MFFRTASVSLAHGHERGTRVVRRSLKVGLAEIVSLAWQAVRSVKVAVIGKTGTFCLARQQRMMLADLGEHAVEPCAPALASLGRILLLQQTLAGDRHRLRDGRVERLG